MPTETEKSPTAVNPLKKLPPTLIPFCPVCNFRDQKEVAENEIVNCRCCGVRFVFCVPTGAIQPG